MTHFKHHFDGKTISLVQFDADKPVLFCHDYDVGRVNTIVVVHGDSDEVQVWNFGFSMLDQLNTLVNKGRSLADCSLQIESRNEGGRPYPRFQLLMAPRKATDHLQADIDRLKQWVRRLSGAITLKVGDPVSFVCHSREVRGVVVIGEFDGKVQIRWEDGVEHKIDVLDQNLMLIENPS